MLKKEKRFYPDYVFTQLMLVFFLFGLLTTLAILLPLGLPEKANPLETPESIKPEWYFLASFQLIKYFPKSVGTLLVVIGLILLFAFPFAGRKIATLPHGKVWLRGIGVSFIFGYILLTGLGWLSETTRNIFGASYHFDYYGMPHRVGVTERAQPKDLNQPIQGTSQRSGDEIEP